MKRIIVLGAGTAGTMMAAKLAKELNTNEWTITVIDRDNDHLYQPGLLFLPFGIYKEKGLVRPRNTLLPEGVDFILSDIARIEPDNNKVFLKNGDVFSYEILIVATGTRLVPEETKGLTGPGWRDSITDFYTLEGSKILAEKLENFKGGKLVLNVVDMPIKCPVAPLEFLFLADAYFTERGMRDKVEIVYATPLEGAFTKPKASAMLGGLLDSRNIKVVADFNLDEVHGEEKVMKSYDGIEVDYDLLVTVPLHAGSQVIHDSQMGDDFGFLPTHKHTLKANEFDNVFAIGDATNLPTSKAGSVAHFQAEVLIENVLRHIDGKEPLPAFDGHANCFIETGYGKAILIDFNYTTEPLPGRFPLPGVGPFALLEESFINHWGKLGFRWTYWNMLLKGEELPINHLMLMAGKWS